MIGQYSGIVPKGDLMLIQKLCEKMKGRCFLHVNSTRSGGGVAEILQRMVPFLEELGIDVRWEVVKGDSHFFNITKKIHNALQGDPESITKEMWDYHFEVNRKSAGEFSLDADMALIHDPQPAPLVEFRKRGHWVWRCHIDVSNPIPEVWDRLSRYCGKYDAAIFSVQRFARTMAIDQFLIPPAIDPVSEKNRELTKKEIDETLAKFHLSRERPILLQVSRFDRFKDPIGVMKAYRIVKKYNDCILILAGSPATDDPEGEIVLDEVREAAEGDPDIHILLLAPLSDKEINVLQRTATVVLQKSLKEGFGLTVSEAMWKGKPVIGGDVGGIPLQIIHNVTGFLVHSPEGAAFRVRQLLNNPDLARKVGENAKAYVKTNFLITRQIRDYLSLWYIMENRGKNFLEL